MKRPSLGISDFLRVMAEEEPLIPEVLPPAGGHLGRFQRITNLLRDTAQAFAREAANYSVSVKSRDELWKARKGLEKLHDELYRYLEMIGKVDEDWEEEEFQESEKRWRQRRNPMV